MPRSLYRRIEKALVTIAHGSSGRDAVQQVAEFLVSGFSDDLGIEGGRIYEAEDRQYRLVASFGAATTAPVGFRVPRSYPQFEQLLDEGAVVMHRDDPSLDPRLEADVGTSEYFAAIAVADGAFILSLDVDEQAHREPGDLLATLNIIRLAVNQKLREARMQELLEDARRIQASILPRRLPRYGDYDLAARSVPAEIVGGDFYDVITQTDSSFDVVVADATGHGLPAALQVRDVYTGLRMGLSREFKLTRTVERLNRIIHRSRWVTKFVSLVVAEIDVSGTVLYCSAGHPPGIVARADGSTELLRTGGLLLGPRPDARYTIDVTRLGPGELLLLYSDGITEARRPTSDDELGVEELRRIVAEARTRPAAEIVDRIFAAAAEFSGTDVPEDDQTAVVVARRGTSPPEEQP